MPQFLEQLDIAAFVVPSSTTDNDKTSLLRLQKLVSSSIKKFSYLEIGSDRGGSLVPLLADPNCAHIISVDLRPEQQPDERGTNFPCPIDGEAQMLNNLRQCVGEGQLARLRTFKLDVRDVDATSVPKIDLVLIDGEHTDVACFSDADRILDFVKQDAVIAFHDSNLISDAIQNFERMLTRLNIKHSTVFLPDVVAAIGIGKFESNLSKELGGVSAPRSTFLNEAQLHRWVSVAASMKERGIVPDASAEMQSKIDALEAQLEQERRAVASLRKELTLARKQIDMLLHSKSWKLTAPLRYLKAKIF